MKLKHSILLLSTLLAITQGFSQKADTTYKAQFTVMGGTLDEYDVSEELVANQVRTEFYQLAGDTAIYMENISPGFGSKSYGAISGLRSDIMDLGDTLGMFETFTFKWHFLNSYDLTTGIIECQFSKVYTDKGTYSRLIMPTNEGYMVYDGYMMLNNGKTIAMDEKQYDLIIGKDSTAVKEGKDFVRGVANAITGNITFELLGISDSTCALTVTLADYEYWLSSWNCGTHSFGEDALTRFTKYDERLHGFSQYMTIRDNLVGEFLYFHIVALPKTHAELENSYKLFRFFYLEKDMLEVFYPKEIAVD